MLASCQAWRSSAFLFLGLGLSRLVSATECTSSYNISSAIPSCALQCVETFISTQYASGVCCTSLSCLCQTNTTSGLTIGEGALACLFGSCSSDTIAANETTVYGICDGVSGALPETHSSITATRLTVVTQTSYGATTTTTMQSTSSTLVSIAPSSSVVSSTTIPPITSISSLGSIATTTAAATTTTTTSASIATTSAASTATTSLSSPAVIGVSVASGVSAIFLVGVSIVCCGRRLRRKRLDREKESFEIGGHMSEPPEFTAAVRASIAAPPSSQQQQAINSSFNQFPSQPIRQDLEQGQGQEQSQEEVSPGPLVVLTNPGQNKEIYEIGVSPDTEYGGSPQSHTSQRTLSRLIPESATTQEMFPEPLRVIRNPAMRPTSEATVFEEEQQQRPSSIFGPPLDKSQLTSNRQLTHDNHTGSPLRAIGLPANPRPQRQNLTPTRNLSPRNLSDFSYKWNKSAATIPSTASSRPQQPPQPLHSDPNFSRLGRGLHSVATPQNTTHADTSYETAPIEDDYWTAERSKISNAQLMSVQELPAQASPVRQPAMPRSAAAAIVPAAKEPRRSQAAVLYYANLPVSIEGANIEGSAPAVKRPGAGDREDAGERATFFIDSMSRSRSSSPGNNSLLAKRRGESVADEMESRFRSGVQPKYAIHTTSGSASASASTRGQGQDQQQGINKSSRTHELERHTQSQSQPQPQSSPQPGPGGLSSPPLQAHNITPTRRGEDLYLRVD